MPAQAIDGKLISEQRRAALGNRVAALRAHGLHPALAAITTRPDHGWALYLKNQAAACGLVGIGHRQLELPSGCGQDDLSEAIEGLNLDPLVHGIILQSPLNAPGMELNELQAQAQLSPDKDVEGVNPANLGLLLAGRQALAPCTALSAVALAMAGCVLIGRGDLTGMEACVVGASTIVGKPIAQLLLAAGATVTICHVHTRALAEHTRRADLLVVAVGRAGLITADMVKPGAVVIDVGINRRQLDGGRSETVGDVAPEVGQVAAALSPVPGGVGALTTTILLESTVTAAERLDQSAPSFDAAAIARLVGSASEELPRDTAERIATLLSRHVVGVPNGRPWRSALSRRLGRGVTVLDGATGTELIARGVAPARVTQANLEHPDLVLAVHRAYVEAGAEAITANTFGANRYRLSGREEALSLAVAGVRLARQAALSVPGRTVFVLASLGPLGQLIGAELPVVDAEEAFAEVALAMADHNVDGFILETMSSTAEALAGLRGVRRVSRLPVLVCRSIDRADALELGDFAQAMEDGGATAIGVNCAAGPRALEPVVATLAGLTRLPVIARPNAGFPSQDQGQLHYHLRPEYLVERARAYVASGVRILGGCCGVSPAHIHALAQAASSFVLPPPGALAPPQRTVAVAPADAAPRGAAEPARADHPLLSAMRSGAFPVLALLAGRISPVAAVAAAQRLTAAGARGIGLLGGWPGSPRGSRLAAQVRHLQDASRQPGILELIPADLTLGQAQDIALTAHLMGLSVLLVDGGVFAGMQRVDRGHPVCEPLALVRMLCELNHGRDVSGTRLSEPTAFTIGVRLRRRDAQLAVDYAAAGAHFLTIQPIYEPAAFREAMGLAQGAGLPLLAETLLLPDAATADELDNELPELSVPARLKERLRADSTEDVRGVLRFIAAWRAKLSGVVVMAADERTDMVEAVVSQVAGPRPPR